MGRYRYIQLVWVWITLLVLWTPDNTLRASNKLQGGIVVKPAADEAMFSEDSLQLYKERAILAARENKVEDAAYYAELYVKYAAEPSFLESRYFHNVSQSDAFQSLIKSYSFRFDWINFFYLFSALTGFFIGTILLLKRGQDRVSKLLISTFVLIHSVFIFDIFLYNTNLRFKAPHVLYMSGSFSYLYGPLIYFYFKRITTKYQFQKWDLLHLLPTALAFLVLLPIYLLPESEKVKVMFNVGNFDRIPLWICIGKNCLSFNLWVFNYTAVFQKQGIQNLYPGSTTLDQCPGYPGRGVCAVLLGVRDDHFGMDSTIRIPLPLANHCHGWYGTLHWLRVVFTAQPFCRQFWKEN